MRVEGSEWADVTFDENGRWHTVWWMGDEPAGQVYDCEVRAIDRAGRVSNVSKALLIDLPVRETLQTTLTAQPERVTTATEATFAFTGADNQGNALTRFQCQIDGEPLAACTSPVTYRGLSNGEYTLRVFAMNESGQMDPTPATYAWTVDDGTTPPPVDTTRRIFLPLIARNQTVVAGNAPQPTSDAPTTVGEPVATEAAPVETVINETVINETVINEMIIEETAVEETLAEETAVEEAPVEQPAVDPPAAEASTTEPADQPEPALENADGAVKQIYLPVALR
jgi:hypothetical protein